MCRRIRTWWREVTFLRKKATPTVTIWPNKTSLQADGRARRILSLARAKSSTDQNRTKTTRPRTLTDHHGRAKDSRATHGAETASEYLLGVTTVTHLSFDIKRVLSGRLRSSMRNDVLCRIKVIGILWSWPKYISVSPTVNSLYSASSYRSKNKHCIRAESSSGVVDYHA